MSADRSQATPDLTEAEGAKFLAQLDAAGAGREVSGPHAESARFGAALAERLNRSSVRLPVRPSGGTFTWIVSAAALVVATAALFVWLLGQQAQIAKPEAPHPDVQGLPPALGGPEDEEAEVAPPKPVFEVDEDAVRRHIEALASDHPEERDRAQAALRGMGEAVLPILRNGLEKTKDPEVRMRLQALILEHDEARYVHLLDRPIDLKIEKMPLRDALALWSKATGIPIQQVSFESAPVVPATLLTLKTEGMTARHALRWLARWSNLVTEVDGLGARLVVPGRARERMTQEVYDLRDMPLGVGLQASDLAHLIPGRILHVAFARPEAVCRNEGQRLVVTVGRSSHESVRNVLAQLRESMWRSSEPRPAVFGPDYCAYRIDRLSKAERMAQDELLRLVREEKVTMDFNNADLDWVANALQTLTNITVVVDPRISKMPQAVTILCDNKPLEDVLQAILKPAGLDYAVLDGAIWITMPQFTFEAVELGIYDVRDISAQAERGWGPAPIADLLRNVIAPESWDPNVGTSIEEYNGMLVVMQRPDKHERIRKMIHRIRTSTLNAKAFWAMIRKELDGK
ncbi:MAG: hypothetical protein AMXMBFR7_30740 [Planctomycetota bacterium]